MKVARSPEISATRELAYWSCTFCSELNAPEIYRCKNCHRLRENDGSTVTVSQPISPERIAFRRQIESSSATRAAWLVSWSNDGKPASGRQVVLVAVAFLLLAAITLPPGYPESLLGFAVAYGTMNAMVGALRARTYRSDRFFVVATAAFAFAEIGVYLAVLYLFIAFAPHWNGLSLSAYVGHQLMPNVDAVSLGIAVFFAAVFGVLASCAVYRYAVNRRLRMPLNS